MKSDSQYDLDINFLRIKIWTSKLRLSVTLRLIVNLDPDIRMYLINSN